MNKNRLGKVLDAGHNLGKVKGKFTVRNRKD
jgi:hypothetical protein